MANQTLMSLLPLRLLSEGATSRFCLTTKSRSQIATRSRKIVEFVDFEANLSQDALGGSTTACHTDFDQRCAIFTQPKNAGSLAGRLRRFVVDDSSNTCVTQRVVLELRKLPKGQRKAGKLLAEIERGKPGGRSV